MKQQTGASLLEAMIAVLIIGFGLLGVAAMQSRAIAMNQSAYYRGIAADLGADLAERIRALRSPFMAGTGTASTPPIPPNFSVCSLNNDLALACANQTNGTSAALGARVVDEMTRWNALRASQLPGGSSYTLVSEAGGGNGFFRYTLTLTWLDNRNADCTLVPNPCLASYSVVIE
jgi:type IV pilus assembly protein PilV